MNKIVLFFIAIPILQLLFQHDSYSQLSGNYTIGAGGNYLTINSAVTDLVTYGVSAPVTFNIKSGTYDEQVTINEIPGASMINRIIFQSQAQTADSVMWKSTAPDRKFVLFLNNADFVTIRKMNLSDADYQTSSGIKIVKLYGTTNISILDNKFFYGRAYEVDISVIEGSNFSTDSIRIEGNIFEGGVIKAASINSIMLSNISGFVKISGNQFNRVGYCIVATSLNSVLIEKNSFTADFFDIAPGIQITAISCNGSLKISKNRFAPTYLPGIQIVNCSPVDGMVSNNLISAGFSTGIKSENSQFIKYYHNTIVQSGRGVNINFINSNFNYLKNNIFLNYSDNVYPGNTIEIEGSILYSDFNNFYNYDPQNFGHYNGSHLGSLEAWVSASGNDSNSSKVPVSISNYHLTGQSIGDINLIGVPLSEVTDDYDDQSRSQFFPYMGADEPAHPGSIHLFLTALIEGFYNSNIGKTPTDTIKANLRNTFPPYSVVDFSKSIFNMKGVSILKFLNAQTGNYFVELKHRNSITTWSKTGGTNLVSGESSVYDFTNAISQAFGSNMVLKGTKFCIYSGDVNQDEFVDLSDLVLIFNDANNFASGYILTDVNGDYFADLSDLTITYNNTRIFVSVIRP